LPISKRSAPRRRTAAAPAAHTPPAAPPPSTPGGHRPRRPAATPPAAAPRAGQGAGRSGRIQQALAMRLFGHFECRPCHFERRACHFERSDKSRARRSRALTSVETTIGTRRRQGQYGWHPGGCPESHHFFASACGAASTSCLACARPILSATSLGT